MSGKRWSDAEIAEMARRRELGQTWREIAAAIGRSHHGTAQMAYRHRIGIWARPAGGRNNVKARFWTTDRLAQAQVALRGGATLAAAAATVRGRGDGLWLALRRVGVDLKRLRRGEA